MTSHRRRIGHFLGALDFDLIFTDRRAGR